LFIKPVEEEADTTATIMTNKRIYFFEMHAEEAKGAFDNRVAFFVKFRYPQTQTATGDDDGSIIQYNTGSIPNLANPEDYNFNYTMSGDEIISPIATFDDGEFTYFQFKPNSPLPAVFPVDNDGMEGASNFRVAGDYIIVEKTGAVFTLRSGSATVCVYNENLIKNHPLAARTKNNTQTLWGSVKSLLNKNRS
jgi:type IV secretion system protein VirB9